MQTLEVNFLGAGLVDQRYCFEMLKWIVKEVRRTNLGMSRPATMHLMKQGVVLNVREMNPNDLIVPAIPTNSKGQRGARRVNHSTSAESRVELEPKFRAVRRMNSIHEIRVDYSQVHRFLPLDSSRYELCCLVKPQVAKNSIGSKDTAALESKDFLMSCYLFTARSSTELTTIVESFEAARRMTEPSREGAQIDNIDTLLQVGCTFFEVAYIGHTGVGTQTVAHGNVDTLIVDLVRCRNESSENYAPTMLLEIADTFVCLINTVNKRVALSREIRNISYVFQGSSNSKYVGIVVRENDSSPTPNGSSAQFSAYVFECCDKTVADECIHTLRRVFEATRSRNPMVYRCPQCPVVLLNNITQRVDRILLSHLQLDTAASSELVLQSRLASYIETAAWLPELNVHRLGALVQETSASLLDSQANCDIYMLLVGDLHSALRTERAQSSLGDAMLSLKAVLDTAQHEHKHVKEAPKPPPKPVVRERVQSNDADVMQPDAASNGKQRGKLTGLLGKFKLFSKDGTPPLVMPTPTVQKQTKDSSASSEGTTPADSGARQRTRSLLSPIESSSAALNALSIPKPVEQPSAAILPTLEKTDPVKSQDPVPQPSIDKPSNLPVAAIASEEVSGRQRAHSDSQTLSRTATPIVPESPSGDKAQAKTSDLPRNLSASNTTEASAIVKELLEKNESNAHPGDTEDYNENDSVSETLTTRRGKFAARLKGSAMPLDTRRDQKNGRPPHIGLRRGLSVCDQPSNKPNRRMSPSFITDSNVRVGLYRQVIKASGANSRLQEMHQAKLQTHDNDLSDSFLAGNRNIRVRWVKVIWMVIFMNRSRKIARTEKTLCKTADERLTYDDMAVADSACDEWHRTLTRAKDGRLFNLKELRRLAKIGVPKEIRGQVWLFLIEQHKARCAAELESESINAEAESEADDSLSNASSISSPVRTPTTANLGRRTTIQWRNERTQRLKSALLVKDKLSIHSASSRHSVSMEESARTYDRLLSQLISRDVGRAIMIDLGRTFPQFPYFSSGKGVGQLSLFNLLKVYSLDDPEVGYCQGLGFIAGVLLLHLSEHEAFYALSYFMKDLNFREHYLPNMLGIQIREYQLEHLLLDEDGALHSHLMHHDITSSLYASSWLLTLFASSFPIGFVARIMDFLFCDGSVEVLLRTVLLLLIDHRELIMSFHSTEMLIELLKSTLPAMAPLQIDRIIEKLFSLESLSGRLRDYELEFCVTQETHGRMMALELENENLRGLLRQIESYLPNDRNDLRRQVQVALSRHSFTER